MFFCFVFGASVLIKRVIESVVHKRSGFCNKGWKEDLKGLHADILDAGVEEVSSILLWCTLRSSLTVSIRFGCLAIEWRCLTPY